MGVHRRGGGLFAACLRAEKTTAWKAVALRLPFGHRHPLQACRQPRRRLPLIGVLGDQCARVPHPFQGWGTAFRIPPRGEGHCLEGSGTTPPVRTPTSTTGLPSTKPTFVGSCLLAEDFRQRLNAGGDEVGNQGAECGEAEERGYAGDPHEATVLALQGGFEFFAAAFLIVLES